MASMCNAYSLTHARREIVGFSNDLARQHSFALAEPELPPDFAPRYRISPRQRAPILRLEGAGKLGWTMGLWGFLTKGGKPGFAPTNARDDKLATGWPWKMVSRHQRCLVPADGFFEPEKPAGDKGTVPWSYYALGNRQVFMMAGLWNEAPHPKTGEAVETFTVVTTAANGVIRKHDRMPVMLEDDDMMAWLEPGAVPIAILKPYPAERMTAWRVMDEARNSRIPDHSGMVEPIAE